MAALRDRHAEFVQCFAIATSEMPIYLPRRCIGANQQFAQPHELINAPLPRAVRGLHRTHRRPTYPTGNYSALTRLMARMTTI